MNIEFRTKSNSKNLFNWRKSVIKCLKNDNRISSNVNKGSQKNGMWNLYEVGQGTSIRYIPKHPEILIISQLY